MSLKVPTNPNIAEIITEDDTPVDNFPSEKQQRLLTEPLYSSWSGPGEQRPFLAAANVGLFASTHLPPLVPDMFLSLDVEIAEDWWSNSHRSYFLWEFGKSPEVVIEIVSNREGNENTTKLHRYAWMGVTYYVIFDPIQHLKGEVLTIYRLNKDVYERYEGRDFPEIGLGLTLWQGSFENKDATWLRWCERDGTLIPTGHERAEQERYRAEQESQRAELERQRAERLAARLRALGEDPDQL